MGISSLSFYLLMFFYWTQEGEEEGGKRLGKATAGRSHFLYPFTDRLLTCGRGEEERGEKKSWKKKKGG